MRMTGVTIKMRLTRMPVGIWIIVTDWRYRWMMGGCAIDV